MTCPPNFEEVAVKVQLPAILGVELLDELLLPLVLLLLLPPPQPIRRRLCKTEAFLSSFARTDENRLCWSNVKSMSDIAEYRESSMEGNGGPARHNPSLLHADPLRAALNDRTCGS